MGDVAAAAAWPGAQDALDPHGASTTGLIDLHGGVNLVYCLSDVACMRQCAPPHMKDLGGVPTESIALEHVGRVRKSCGSAVNIALRRCYHRLGDGHTASQSTPVLAISQNLGAAGDMRSRVVQHALLGGQDRKRGAGFQL